MQDEQNEVADDTQGETATETATEAEVKSAERTYTQSELNAIAAKEYQRGKRTAAKKQKEQPPVAEPKQSDDRLDVLMNEIMSLKQSIQDKEKKTSFAAIASAFDAPAPVLAALEKSFDPSDPATTLEALKAIAPQTKKDDSPIPGAPYQSPGTQSSLPREADVSDPNSWTRDDIARLRKEGRFLDLLDEYAANLPGGHGNVFSAKRSRRKK